MVHFGTNLIPKFNPEYVANNVTECLLSIKRRAGPKCKIVYSGILPKIDVHFLGGIRFVNDRVIYAGKVGPPSVQWGYVDNMSLFMDNRGKVNPKFFKKDGIHLLPLGADVFNNSIKRLFNVSQG